MGKVYYFCLVSETVEIFFYNVSLINAIKYNEDMSEEDTARENRIVQLYLKYFFISDDRSTLYFMVVIKNAACNDAFPELISKYKNFPIIPGI